MRTLLLVFTVTWPVWGPLLLALIWTRIILEVRYRKDYGGVVPWGFLRNALTLILIDGLGLALFWYMISYGGH